MAGGLEWRAGTQYEPELYQPRGQVPVLMTGAGLAVRSTSESSMRETLNGVFVEAVRPRLMRLRVRLLVLRNTVLL